MFRATGWKVMADSVEGSMKEKRQSALKLALIEIAVVFVSEVGWNLVRKTGQSTIDALGITLLTAISLCAFHNR